MRDMNMEDTRVREAIHSPPLCLLSAYRTADLLHSLCLTVISSLSLFFYPPSPQIVLMSVIFCLIGVAQVLGKKIFCFLPRVFHIILLLLKTF